MIIEREFVQTLKTRLRESEPLIQVVLGPRQVGKTTGVLQFLEAYKGPSHYASADDTLSATNQWVDEQWQNALEKGPSPLLVIDEIQKVHNWAEVIKRLWDASRKKPRIKCILLGSSSLSLQKGLTESLTGRFELIPVHHWTAIEFSEAFQCDFETYLRFGGYPGAFQFKDDYERWFAYMKSSVVDTVIGQDILTHQTVAKPALFRQAFEILCSYPAQEISYTKLLGQLQDKGNTDLVKHYLELYEGAFLFRSLQKYSTRALSVKGSSPKIIPLCPALVTLARGGDIHLNPDERGHIFEAVVGTILLQIAGNHLFYWREKNDEVDYVCRLNGKTFAVEVKSGRRKRSGGLQRFKTKFQSAKTCVITMDNFLKFAKNPGHFLTSYSI